MQRNGDLEEEVRALLEGADWDELVPRLQAFARHCLAGYGEVEGRRWQKVTESYVLRALEALAGQPGQYAQWHRWETLFQLLCMVARQLIDEDEQRLQRILDTMDWADLIPRVIAHTVRRLGSATSRHGKSPEDYVYDAVLQLFTRRRHFPLDRDVPLFRFLCVVVHGMRTNELNRLATEGRHSSFPPDDGSWGDAGLVTLAAAGHETADPLATLTAEAFIGSLEPELAAYARLRAADGRWTAKEYAAALGVDVPTIRNYSRRLRRRRDRWDRGRLPERPAE